MERELLLLGLLRKHEMHGYQINEFIDTHLGTSIEIKKPTVYKILARMERDGLIGCREEQEGNYPTRRVYFITINGEKAFQKFLRENLATYKPDFYLNDIGIAYLDYLPADEATSLLNQRRTQIANFIKKIQEDEAHQGNFRQLLSYQLCHLKAELEWLNGYIDQMYSEKIGEHLKDPRQMALKL